jgi:hypothetical protein
MIELADMLFKLGTTWMLWMIYFEIQSLKNKK